MINDSSRGALPFPYAILWILSIRVSREEGGERFNIYPQQNQDSVTKPTYRYHPHIPLHSNHVEVKCCRVYGIKFKAISCYMHCGLAIRECISA